MRLSWGAGRIIIAVTALLAAGSAPSAAAAQGSSVKAMLEKHDLLGIFAYDCNKPIGSGNFYFVVWARDDGRVQRDQRSSLRSIELTMVLDQATELAPNKVSTSGTSNGKRSQIVWQLEKNRLYADEYTVGDKKVIVGGKFTSNGLDVHWIYKCNVPGTLTNALGGPGSVKTVFERHNLLGTFAKDCSQPAKAEENWYFVDSLIDPDHVQRDRMASQTARASRTIIDQAFELTPNEIVVRGSADNQATFVLYHVDNKRMVQWEAISGGQPLISKGKWIKTQADMPWLNRCGN